MKIQLEKTYFGFTKETTGEYAGMAILENDRWLLIHKDGTAVDPNGQHYARVSKEVASRPMPADEFLQYACDSWEDMDKEPPETFPIPDTDLVTLGWTTESDKPVVIPLQREE